MSAASDLDKVLAREREALLAADYAALPALAAQKDRLVRRMSGTAGTAVPELSAAARRIRDNQALLKAALDGVRHVRDRATRTREAGAFTTYDRQGAVQRVETGPGPGRKA